MIKCYCFGASGNGRYMLRLVDSRCWEIISSTYAYVIFQFHLLDFGLICDSGVVVVGFTMGPILIWSASV